MPLCRQTLHLCLLFHTVSAVTHAMGLVQYAPRLSKPPVFSMQAADTFQRALGLLSTLRPLMALPAAKGLTSDTEEKVLLPPTCDIPWELQKAL